MMSKKKGSLANGPRKGARKTGLGKVNKGGYALTGGGSGAKSGYKGRTESGKKGGYGK